MRPDKAALDVFPTGYGDARERFLALARERGARLATHPIGASGPAGEPLGVDTAYLGAARPRRLFVVLSGTHGVEGFAGSALQQQWLRQFEAGQLPDDGGVLLIHALNPYGFAWLRRVNENNVDINRNALEQFPGPINLAYRRLDDWLNPTSPPGYADFFVLGGTRLLLRHGFAALQQAIVAGQYEFPRGLFYGGAGIEESTAILFAILGGDAWQNVEQSLLLDVHTGIGRFATYKLMVDVAEDSAPYRQLAQWFGADAVASNRPQGSIAYRVSGGLTESITRRFGAGRMYAAVLEFGTRPGVRVLAALRRENRAYHHCRASDAPLERAREDLREMFSPRSAQWRECVLRQGARVLSQGLRACFSSAAAAAALPRTAEE